MKLTFAAHSQANAESVLFFARTYNIGVVEVVA